MVPVPWSVAPDESEWLDDLYALGPRIAWEPRADSLLWLGAARAEGA